MSPVPTIGKTADGHKLAIDVDVFIGSRGLVQANSGGGKSWLLRRILEQTHGLLPQIVIDPEDEFLSLRERHDYVIAAPRDGDVVADVRTAALLARKLLELRTSAILAIYELKPAQRAAFVKAFLESLVSAPRSLWGPTLVVLDEAHKYAPQSGKAESTSAVVDLAALGRKRGLCALVATQRISKLSKDVAAELQNKMIGRCGLVTDRDRAADELGLPNAQRRTLQLLDPGSFFVFGPALSREVVEVRVGPVKTTHPKAGQRAAAPPAPRAKVKAVLAKLSDLPKEAEQEARDAAELRAQLAAAKRDLKAARRGAADPEAIARAREQGRVEGEAAARRDLAAAIKLAEKVRKAAGAQVAKAASAIARAGEALDVQSVAAAELDTAASAPIPKRSAPPPVDADRGDLDGPEQRILDAIAWLDSIGVDQPEVTAVAFLAGYKAGGGAFNNPKGRLRRKGLIEYLPGKLVRLTDEGRAAAAPPVDALTTAELHRAVLGRLGGPEQRILQPLLDAYPESLSNDELAAAANYTAGAGAFNNPRGRLRSLGLVEYPEPGRVVARDILFPEGR